ncbi:MAG TPA: adenylate/guanylate cyclase domain-containing protein [Candidatus Limnocylindria bacterium]|nr:adenylate/guanylate cyclase domain-containing protein [Candidatus Limnocylindria bacterium]
MRINLPAGTVTFLFTDIESSTRLLHELGTDAYANALGEHRRLLRDAFARHGGVEVDTQGDAFFVAFPTAQEALAAATEAQQALAEAPIRVRIGLHTGTPLLTSEGYVGPDVHRAARICAAGHGGQVLVSAATAGLVGHDGLVDMGEHRLKDLSAPERIYQLGAGEFPPLKTLYQTNLPVPTTNFLGRQRELAEIDGVLARDEVRLLTLTGPGGTGKTRLALQAAGASAERFPDGVWWVPLAPLRDPQLVVATISGVLGASGDLATHVADKRLLLVLDNFEQLIAAAAEVGELLGRCPNLHLLVTSRELLQLPGEHHYPVPPLEPPQGVELFLARARAAKPDFAGTGAVAELCARLDNLPLAIELAAARTRMLSPEQLLARIGQRLDLLKGGRGVDARQETLRATIEWSHDLLSDDEQRLFARLAVFRGGWTLEAAEAVVDADLETLQSLVDKSLVRVRDERFTMLETIREYAAERLQASGDADELRRRHAQFFVALAEQAEPEVKRGTPKDWLERLDREHDNLRAAHDRLEAAGDTEGMSQLAGALVDFWQIRGHFAEGRRRLERALGSDDRRTMGRARALHAAVMLEDDVANLPVARARAEEGLRIQQELGSAHGVAFALHGLGWVAALGRDWVSARDTWEASRQAFREVGDDHFFLALTRSVAWASEELGDKARYWGLVEEYAGRARELRNRRVLARGLAALGWRALEEGRLDEALELTVEGYRIDADHGFVVHVANDLVRFAAVTLRAGQPSIAAALVALSDRLYEEVGTLRESWAAEERDEAFEAIRAQLAPPAYSEAWQQGRDMTPDEAVALVLNYWAGR